MSGNYYSSKKAPKAILIWDKIGFKAKGITKRELIIVKFLRILYTYTLIDMILKYIKQKCQNYEKKFKKSTVVGISFWINKLYLLKSSFRFTANWTECTEGSHIHPVPTHAHLPH